MVLIKLNDDLIIISANCEILLFDTCKKFIKKFVLDKPTAVAKINSSDPQEHHNDYDNSDEQIQDMCFSPNKKYIALTTTVDKLLYFYKVLDNDIELLSKRVLSRTSSAIRFSPDSQIILVADKTGDCYSFDCQQIFEPGKWILGHLSMILDVLFTNDKRFIITCDRDEKIRLTNYPDTQIIESYCLGHKEYIGAIDFLPSQPNDVLVSISGDKHLKLWQLPNGIEIFDYELPQPALKLAVLKYSNTCDHVAITFVDSFDVFIYKIAYSENKFSCNVIYDVKVNNSKYFSNIQYDSNHDLWLASVDENNFVSLHRIYMNDCNLYNIESLNSCNNILKENLGKITFDMMENNNSILFKKKFDNIEDYQKRKKLRIEEKNKLK